MTSDEIKNFKVELVYSVEDDLQGKYLKYQFKANNIADKIKTLQYIKLNEVFVHNMPEVELLHFSQLIDSELNLRYGTREFKVLKDSDAQSCKG